MRFAAGWLAVVWLVVGCTVSQDGVRTCTVNEECGEGGRCDVSAGLCYAEGTEPELDTCSPACPEYQACTAEGCKRRFTALKFLSPTPDSFVSGGPVQVVAQLVVNPTYARTTRFPDTLSFSAARSDNGDVGSFGSVTRTGDTYIVTWTPPEGIAQVTLTASHPNPAAVQSSAVQVRVDQVPPSFTLSFSSPPARATGSATLAHQKDPAQDFADAFRRDESVTVTVSSNEAVTDVVLTVAGVGPNGAPGAFQSPVQVEPGTGCDGDPAFCGHVTVDLSVPEMRAFRGTMGFNVEGRDAAGNRGTASGQLKVTRWKWAFDAPVSIVSTPSIGNKGTVYFGTSTGGATGKMYALGPDGAKLWESETGDVTGSSAVGSLRANAEFIYVGARTAQGLEFKALRSGSGTGPKCPPRGTSLGAAAVGLTAYGAQTYETGLNVCSAGGGCIAGYREDATLPVEEQCFGAVDNAVTNHLPGGALVMKGFNLFYGTPTGSVTSYVADRSNTPRPGWPQSTGQLTRGLAMVGTSLYAAASNSDNPSVGGLYKLPESGGSLLLVYPASASSRVFNLSVGKGNIAYFGAETGTAAELLALALDTPGATPLRALNVGTLRGAPVVAKNDRLYTLNTQGRVTAWTASSLTPEWQLELGLSLGSVDVSPTLDCRRDASGLILTDRSVGTLYIAGTNRLHAFIVDSPGLDPEAPWPKYQHDARNTGNPDTPIAPCQ